MTTTTIVVVFACIALLAVAAAITQYPPAVPEHVAAAPAQPPAARSTPVSGRVLVAGTFDLLSEPHMKLLRRALPFGRELFVGVVVAPETKARQSFTERAAAVQQVPFVTHVFPVDSDRDTRHYIDKHGAEVWMVEGEPHVSRVH